MKTLRIFSGLLIVLSVVFLNSCRKDQPYLTCKINGKEFTSLFRVSYRGNLPVVGESFLITATDGAVVTEGQYLTMLIRGVQEKDYNLDVELTNGVYQAAAVYKPKGKNDTTSTYKYYGVSGHITLTKVDEKHKKISGTFEFTLKNKLGDVVKITEGKFENLSYIQGVFSTEEFNEDENQQ